MGFFKRVLSHKEETKQQVIDKTFHQNIKYIYRKFRNTLFCCNFYLIFSYRAVRTAGYLSSDTAGLTVVAVFVVVANEIGDTVVKGAVVVVLRWRGV